MSFLLQMENIHKRFGKRAILQGLCFHVHPGEIVGLLGSNGAGKSTAFQIIMGMLKPDAGAVFLQGQDLVSKKIHERALLGLGYLAQEPSVLLDLSVEDNLLCILELLPLRKKERIERLYALLEELKLTALKDKKAKTLSGGEKRRLEITRCLIRSPTLLLLDEPFANIDPLSIEEVKELMRHLKKRGIGILITDHNARELFSIVDRSYLLQSGKALVSGSTEEIVQDAQAKKHYLGASFQL